MASPGPERHFVLEIRTIKYATPQHKPIDPLLTRKELDPAQVLGRLHEFRQPRNPDFNADTK